MPKVYLTNLGKYTEGFLQGEWLSLPYTGHASRIVYQNGSEHPARSEPSRNQKMSKRSKIERPSKYTKT